MELLLLEITCSALGSLCRGAAGGALGSTELGSDRKFPIERGTEEGMEHLSSCSWIYLSLHIHSIYTRIHGEHKDFVCLSCICGVCVLVVMHLCGDSKLPSKDREGDFPSSLPGRSPESPFLCLLWFAHSDLQKSILARDNNGLFPNQDQQNSTICLCRSLRLTWLPDHGYEAFAHKDSTNVSILSQRGEMQERTSPSTSLV